MKDLVKTLVKPDWDDNPKRSEILHAANLLQVGEFQLIQLAYKIWYKKDLPEGKINKIFSLRKITSLLGVLLLVQIVLGILTLLYGAQIGFASMHQISSIFLVSSSIYLLYKNLKTN